MSLRARIVGSLIWKRVGRHHLAGLYAERERLRSMARTSYQTRKEVARALVEIEGDIAMLEVRLRLPPRL